MLSKAVKKSSLAIVRPAVATYFVRGIARDSRPPRQQAVSHGLRRHLLDSRYNERRTLKQIFDTGPSKNIDFNLPKTGLFGIEHLTHPSGYAAYQREALATAARLIREIKTHGPSRATIDRFDELSDTICLVVDSCEFLRSRHPDPNHVRAAQDTWQSLHTYVTQLNVNQDLYNAMRAVQELPEFETWDFETRRTANLFVSDFEQSGIHLHGEDRNKVINLTDDINENSLLFGEQMDRPGPTLQIPVNKLKGIPNGIVNSFPRNGANVMLPSDAATSDFILKWAADPEVRAAMYRAHFSSSDEDLAIMDRLLGARKDLATICGFNSYAEKVLTDTMAGEPSTVDDFLSTLASCIDDRVQDEMTMLQQLKYAHERSTEAIQPWDRQYYSGIRKAQTANQGGMAAMEYFSLGTCMQGINTILQKVFGLTFRPELAAPGELWDDNVVKIAVEHDEEGLMGYIYCDLYSRPNVNIQPSHYTVRCSRLLPDGSYQIPIVCLVCNFRKPTYNRPPLLQISEVETLFHEMGHALHSMLARTKYHNVAGTRCKLDFVEIPSVMNENFAWDPRVLKQYALHYETGRPIPDHLITNLLDLRRIFAFSELEIQMIYGMMDQAFHNTNPPLGRTSAVVANIQNTYGHVPYEPGTHTHMKFSHLYGYGASYYTYLWSKAYAAKIWNELFRDDPLSRKAGDTYRKEVLAYGGGKEPNEIAKAVLGSLPSNASLVDAIVTDAQSGPMN
eukprot:Clim_evm61s11 gene=Clim_evmTU61s11